MRCDIEMNQVRLYTAYRIAMMTYHLRKVYTLIIFNQKNIMDMEVFFPIDYLILLFVTIVISPHAIGTS